jgi:hypothetical protein
VITVVYVLCCTDDNFVLFMYYVFCTVLFSIAPLNFFHCAIISLCDLGFNVTERLRDASTYRSDSTSESESSEERRKTLNESHQSSHTHPLLKTGTNTSKPRVSHAEMARKTEIYTEWLSKNKEDVELYELASSLFDVQFEAALKLYASYSSREKARIHAPHCEAFL